jgi:hypothetical protein
VRLEYSVAGAALTQVDVTIPADMPPAIDPAGVSAGEIIVSAAGYLLTSGSANPAASRAWLQKISGGYKASVVAASAAYAVASVQFSYQAA